MSLNDDQNLECPLCMEPFEMDDFNFFPCTCGYQICRFCWHRIRTDENGLCPACRKQYPEDPADFKPLSPEELQKIKNEKRQKDQQRKQKMSESRKHLANVRVVQKNLVFVVGLPARLADAEVLKKHDYFGKFGRIHKVVVNQSTSYAGSQGPSASAYVTYYRAEDTLRAIKSVNNIQVDGRILKASLGTTKYCSHFLKNQQCPKSDCMYLHELGDEAASFTKEDMQQGKHQEYERKLQEQILGCNNRKQTSSPTLQSSHMNSNNKEAWPSVPQNMKESRPNRLAKESPQGQKSDSKQNRSKNKHSSSVDSQKSKKNRGKLTDLSQHQNNNVNLNKTTNSKEDNSISKKNQKQKHQKDSSAQPSSQIPLQRLDVQIVHRGSAVTNKMSDVSELNSKNAQNGFVHISEQPVSTLTTTNIKIARSESPSLPPSPTSSSSSSLFTPFGSFSSNFMSSSSPSPPPTTTSHSFGILGPTLQDSNGSAVTASTSPVGVEQGKRKSPNCHLFSDSENSNSLFSHMTNFPLSSESGSYNGHPSTDDEILPTNSSDWHSNYSLNHSQKQQEDDLDFDPWDESAKGLADLMAKEAVHNPSYTTTSLPPGFSHPVTTNAVPTQRIAPPPPGFGSRQHVGNLGHISNHFGITNTDYPPNKLHNSMRDISHPLMSGSSQLFQDAPQSQLGYSSHNKHFPQYNSRDLNSRVNEILRMKNWQESFRALFPNINVSFGSRGTLQKNHNQNAPTWSPSVRELSWLAHDSAILTPGNNSTESQRESPPFWMKSLQQLTLDDSSNGFNGHSSYVTPFALRGHWPSSAQCPPPGFVAPSRSPANTPFQHSQVNQKI